MSNTVKLIIEIPKAEYEYAKQRWMSENDAHKMDYYMPQWMKETDAHRMDYYISNGTPLDDVKAKIADEYANTHHMYPEYASGLSHAYEIIDKCIGKESED